jgi:hypothetical protein
VVLGFALDIFVDLYCWLDFFHRLLGKTAALINFDSHLLVKLVSLADLESTDMNPIDMCRQLNILIMPGNDLFFLRYPEQNYTQQPSKSCDKF